MDNEAEDDGHLAVTTVATCAFRFAAGLKVVVDSAQGGGDRALFPKSCFFCRYGRDRALFPKSCCFVDTVSSHRRSSRLAARSRYYL